ncbi:FMN-dependent NADH-azoreductase [Pseudoxanthomonas winnipegensis]|jgi:FMN-dependent NADH-azoreductase|uniref:FMN dependent NADH:quinone oxidoreductase n=1 Tax=Pseudoxanthomonas winnipegensis TaxID=2480810 RepID=A0A4Q8L540_9GAMM|nr:FMN-dependent NADH-azoreductase [Pseudoxanthomonas winnipegensis]TAA20144.1 FMN-dependent NADH-azoreductase [Pseudoxanthomonas winnipegensis]
MKILHIDSSIQGDSSISRRLSAAIVSRLLAVAPDSRVIYRDLAMEPLPQFSPEVVAAMQDNDGHGTSAAAMARLREALDELLAADTIVVGAPMYNFSIPTQLKSWLDAIAVPGKTFSYGAEGVRGLLGDKRVIVASARGGIYEQGSPAAAAEHHETYLRAFFGFLGVTRFEVVRAEGVRLDPQIAAQAVSDALAQASQLLPT